jgi:hypothetical protein
VTCGELRNGTTSKGVVGIVSTAHPAPATSLDDDLHDLNDYFVDAVNRAVAEGRDDLVAELAKEYSARAMTLMVRELPTAA